MCMWAYENEPLSMIYSRCIIGFQYGLALLHFILSLRSAFHFAFGSIFLYLLSLTLFLTRFVSKHSTTGKRKKILELLADSVQPLLCKERRRRKISKNAKQRIRLNYTKVGDSNYNLKFFHGFAYCTIIHIKLGCQSKPSHTYSISSKSWLAL